MWTQKELEAIHKKNLAQSDQAIKRSLFTQTATIALSIFNSPRKITDVRVDYVPPGGGSFSVDYSSFNLSMECATPATIEKFREFVQLLCEDCAVAAMDPGPDSKISENAGESVPQNGGPEIDSNELPGDSEYSYKWDIVNQSAKLYLRHEYIGRYNRDSNLFTCCELVMDWDKLILLIDRVIRETE